MAADTVNTPWHHAPRREHTNHGGQSVKPETLRRGPCASRHFFATVKCATVGSAGAAIGYAKRRIGNVYPKRRIDHEQHRHGSVSRQGSGGQRPMERGWRNPSKSDRRTARHPCRGDVGGQARISSDGCRECPEGAPLDSGLRLRPSAPEPRSLKHGRRVRTPGW